MQYFFIVFRDLCGNTVQVVLSRCSLNVFYPRLNKHSIPANEVRLPIELQYTKDPFRHTWIAFAFRLY